MKRIVYILFLLAQAMLGQQNKVSLVVLGTVQDGGSPHIGCQKDCCAPLWDAPDPTRKVVALGVIDHEHGKTFLFEATPNLPEQLKLLKAAAGTERETPDGIFLTHAHIGHYTGLQFLGREALGAKNVAVYAMPKMSSFLAQNGPWSQLVALHNIALQDLNDQQPIQLTNNIKVTPFLVPHRDEFSETVGYLIEGPNQKVLFIPDINKWSKWKSDIREEIKKVDYAFLDASFFDGEEINNRDISEIPHPFVIESMALFKDLPTAEKEKVYFIHLNHTNPLLDPESEASKQVLSQGFHIARFKQAIGL
ncbi:MAG: MBL fold metallo-hydrolase [Allomuricauda sp.]|nr:MAG: MBL fold metallo-hydrolase [Allomuricauda sp.]